MRLLAIFFALVQVLSALENVTAVQPCEAFNNMKHTKNTESVKLTTGTSYRVIESKRGQHYIRMEGIAIPNRWVDAACFEGGVKSEQPLTRQTEEPEGRNKGSKMLLALSWQNAFCETHRHVKECKRRGVSYTDTRFSLHGLWPQPRGNEYCNVPYEEKEKDKRHKWREIDMPSITDTTYGELLRIMPGVDSHLHHHEWIKHGTCSGMSADVYFTKAVKLVRQVNDSKLGEFFSQNIGKSVTLEQVRFKMNESFGAGSGRHVELRCQKGLITEVWIHLGSEGDDLSQMLRDGDIPHGNCFRGMIDRAGYE